MLLVPLIHLGGSGFPVSAQIRVTLFWASRFRKSGCVFAMFFPSQTVGSKSSQGFFLVRPRRLRGSFRPKFHGALRFKTGALRLKGMLGTNFPIRNAVFFIRERRCLLASAIEIW